MSRRRSLSASVSSSAKGGTPAAGWWVPVVLLALVCVVYGHTLGVPLM